ncbi:phosphate/phosphite/phosphonate ABC transporter substrate-binding protein [Metabacillus herbersteinensis]|uniref:Phosphate/phosphite/phosphonate ABC transporter substrate-binding protein n=1 Tax=Metabacillus herbersteinensis TaxID=283816 RepID=A0ABV6GA76_9BACI
MRKCLLVIIVFCILIVGCSKVAETEKIEERDVFTIGLIPSQSEGEMQTAINKLTEDLREKLNRKVEIEHFPSYNGVVEALNYNHIDMAYFGPLTYVIAHERSSAKAIVTQLVDNEPYYYSYIIVHADSKWNTLDELLDAKQDLNFAFGSLSSTSGSLIPGIELKKRGVFVTEDDHEFKSVRYTGSHDITAQSVLNKTVDAGAIDSAIFNSLVKSGKIAKEQFKIIWKSDKLFQYPWAVNAETDEETIKELQKAFLSITDKDILNAFGASGFTKTSNKDYESIRKAAISDGRMDDDLDE